MSKVVQFLARNSDTLDMYSARHKYRPTCVFSINFIIEIFIIKLGTSEPPDGRAALRVHAPKNVTS